VGLMNATTVNQSTHCILVAGLIAALKVDSGNKALADLMGGDRGCERGKANLGAAAGSFVMLAALMRATK
jgi:hypothetical protein